MENSMETPLKTRNKSTMCCVSLLSHVHIFVTLWTVAWRLLCPWNFSGKNTRVGCHFPSPGDLPNPGIQPTSPALASRFFTTEPPRKPKIVSYLLLNHFAINSKFLLMSLNAFLTCFGECRALYYYIFISKHILSACFAPHSNAWYQGYRVE